MKSILIILFFLFFISLKSYSQDIINIPEMFQLINDSKDENKLQTQNKNNQALVTANEAANTTLLEKLKNSYRTLQHRYNVIGIAISSAEVGIEAVPLVNSIIADQSAIVDLASDNPQLIFIAYRTEIEFVEKSQSLVGYIIGLSLSLGDVNQMKQSDRKLLFDYIIQELNAISNLSRQTLQSIRYSLLMGRMRSMNPFQGYINKDKDMVNQIITNAKALK